MLDYLLYAAFFLLPFERLVFMLPSGSTIRLVQVVLALLIGGYFINALRGQTLQKIKVRPPKIRAPHLWLGLFLISALISAALVNHARLYIVYASVLFVVIVFYAVSRLVQKKHLPILEKILIVTTGITIVYGLFQFIGDLAGLPLEITGLKLRYTSAYQSFLRFPRVQSFLTEPLFYGNFLLIPISYFYARFLNSQRQPLIIVVLTGSLLMLALTLSRGAFLGAFVSIIVISIMLRVEFKKKVKELALVAAVGFAALLFALGAAAAAKGSSLAKLVSNYYDQTFTAVVEGRQGSVTGRQQGTKRGLEAFKSSPAFGLGIGGYDLWRKKYEFNRETTAVVNNQWIELLAETGIIGSALFLGFLAVINRNALKALRLDPVNTRPNLVNARVWLIAMLAAYAGIAAQYLTFSGFFLTYVWVVLGLIAGLTRIIEKENG